MAMVTVKVSIMVTGKLVNEWSAYRKVAEIARSLWLKKDFCLTAMAFSKLLATIQRIG